MDILATPSVLGHLRARSPWCHTAWAEPASWCLWKSRQLLSCCLNSPKLSQAGKGPAFSAPAAVGMGTTFRPLADNHSLHLS